VNMYETFLRQE